MFSPTFPGTQVVPSQRRVFNDRLVEYHHLWLGLSPSQLTLLSTHAFLLAPVTWSSSVVYNPLIWSSICCATHWIVYVLPCNPWIPQNDVHRSDITELEWSHDRTKFSSIHS